MVEQENETLRDRVADLEKRVHDQNDEITCMRATLADALRRINTLEAGKGQSVARLPQVQDVFSDLFASRRTRASQPQRRPTAERCT